MKRIILEDYREVANILVSMSTSTKEFSKNNLENDVKIFYVSLEVLV